MPDDMGPGDGGWDDVSEAEEGLEAKDSSFVLVTEEDGEAEESSGETCSFVIFLRLVGCQSFDWDERQECR